MKQCLRPRLHHPAIPEAMRTTDFHIVRGYEILEKHSYTPFRNMIWARSIGSVSNAVSMSEKPNLRVKVGGGRSLDTIAMSSMCIPFQTFGCGDVRSTGRYMLYSCLT